MLNTQPFEIPVENCEKMAKTLRAEKPESPKTPMKVSESGLVNVENEGPSQGSDDDLGEPPEIEIEGMVYAAEKEKKSDVPKMDDLELVDAA